MLMILCLDIRLCFVMSYAVSCVLHDLLLPTMYTTTMYS